MTDLITKLGTEFFNRKFSGSYFKDNQDRPGIIRTVDGGQVAYTALGGNSKRIYRSDQTLPRSFFTGLEVFSVPTLGWRSAQDGKYLSFFSRNNRSYHRGLSGSNLTSEHSPLTKWLMASQNMDRNIALNEDFKCMLAMKPEFIPFTVGIQKMREGSLLSFAASPTVAVMPGEEDTFSIYFRQALAGKVLPDGTVVVDIPMLADYVGELQ
jgi:hypothetical protein